MVTIPDVYYARSKNLNFEWPDPDKVTREGYIFTGKWYTTGDPNQQNASTEFNWNTTLTEDTTIYAGWTPDPNLKSKYTVVWWVEKADSNGSLTDKSNYVYSNSVTKENVQVGSVINDTENVVSSHGAYQAKDARHADNLYETKDGNTEYVGKYFALNSGLSDTSVVVARDGSATMNIYLQRKRYNVTFNLAGNGTIRHENNSYTTSWSELGWYQMPFAGKWPLSSNDGNTSPKLTMGEPKS